MKTRTSVGHSVLLMTITLFSLHNAMCNIAHRRVSPGVLVDLISILKVKLKNIRNEVKLRNVNYELSSLEPILAELPLPKKDILDNYAQELEAINSEGWDVENRRREKELAQEFDEEFIELARQVYFINDRRAHVKETIDRTVKELMGYLPTSSVPISIGELVDRISIATNMISHLKAGTFVDGHAVLASKGEVKPLSPEECSQKIRTLEQQNADLFSEYAEKIDTQLLRELTQNLTKINDALWQHEVATRRCEKKGQFDDTFIEHARTIYCLNDERARVKRKINVLTGSSIVEEKELPTIK